MNIKSLLLGSAAALAAVSGAQAADAIVAAEPEPMEYVRVCDAFGTGYFYIPGTETCLKVGGYVRVQVDGRSDFDIGATRAENSGYRTNTRAQLTFDAKSDTELGALGSHIAFRANNNSGTEFSFQDTYITLGGLQVGQFYNYFDKGLPGETVLHDAGPLASAINYQATDTLNNGIRYNFDGGSFKGYVGADAFNSQAGYKTDAADTADEIGINALVGAKFGGVSIDVFGAYEFDNEDGVIASTLTAEIGPGSLGIFGVYATGPNRYWDYSEWTIGAEYAIKVTDKLTITPGAQYWDKVVPVSGDFVGGDAWRVGLTADYAIAKNLAFKTTVNYTDVDAGALGSGDRWDGFVRLQRNF